MFIDNDWWGHKDILARYCETKPKPIFGSMQHGVYPLEAEENWNLMKSRSSNIIPYFCNSKYFYQKCKDNKIKNVYPIGSTFLYLDRMINKKKVLKKEGTIVFTPHSGHIKKKKFGLIQKYQKKKRIFDHEGYIKNVERYSNPPYTVSIIEDDLNDISHYYERKNWSIFSAGNRNEKSFLLNVYNLISKNSNAVFCEITSALYYSMYMGLKVRIAVKSKIKNNVKTFGREISKDKILIQYQKKHPEIFSGKLSIIKAKNIAKERMGYNCLRKKRGFEKFIRMELYS